MSKERIFIDANIYLKLFELADANQVKRILEPLKKVKDKLFVTEQIVGEVQRRKLSLVKQVLDNQTRLLEGTGTLLNTHWQVNKQQGEELQQLLEDLKLQSNKAAKMHSDMAQEIISKVAKSEDIVSKTLNEILDNPLKPSESSMVAARRRKEIGHPPGKIKNPLGDEITWEQLLETSLECEKLWIITLDSDYMLNYRGNLYLNPLLSEDLKRTKISNVYCFVDIVQALKHFAEQTQDKEPPKQKVKVSTNSKTTQPVQPISERPIYSDHVSPYFGSIDNNWLAYQDRNRLNGINNMSNNPFVYNPANLSASQNFSTTPDYGISAQPISPHYILDSNLHLNNNSTFTNFNPANIGNAIPIPYNPSINAITGINDATQFHVPSNIIGIDQNGNYIFDYSIK